MILEAYRTWCLTTICNGIRCPLLGCLKIAVRVRVRVRVRKNQYPKDGTYIVTLKNRQTLFESM